MSHLSVVDQRFNTPGVLSSVERAVWPSIKEKLSPIVWAWYDVHRNDKVTKIFGIYTITISSFGVVKYALTEIFGVEHPEA